MSVRKIILSSFLLAVLLFIYLVPEMATWAVLLPLFLLGLLIVSEGEWPDSWWYMIVAGQILMLFYFGMIPSPFTWLTERGMLFGLAIVGTVLYIFTVIGLALSGMHGVLRWVRGDRS